MSQEYHYHWLVLRDAAALVELSHDLKAVMASGSTNNQITVDLPRHGDPANPLAAIIKVPSISTRKLHSVLSELSWKSTEEAVAWAETDCGKNFLKANLDSFLVARPK